MSETTARLVWTASDGRTRIVECTGEHIDGYIETVLIVERTIGTDALGVPRWEQVKTNGVGDPSLRERDLAELLRLAGLLAPAMDCNESDVCQACSIGEHGACGGNPTCGCRCG